MNYENIYMIYTTVYANDLSLKVCDLYLTICMGNS